MAGIKPHIHKSFTNTNPQKITSKAHQKPKKPRPKTAGNSTQQPETTENDQIQRKKRKTQSRQKPNSVPNGR